jgi:type II secretion system protein C
MRAEATLTILKLLFLAVAALVAADLVMATWKTRLEANPTTALITPAATATTNAAPVEQIIAEVTPLVGTATPKAVTASASPGAKGPATPTGPPPIQDPSATMKLDGTVVAGPASMAFIEISGKQVVAHPGEMLGDFKVASIHDTNVVFDIQDEQRTLWLPSMQPKTIATPPPAPAASAAAPSPSPSAEASAGPQKITVAKSERDQVMQNPQGYMADLRVLPNTKDGKPYGAQVVYLKPGSFIGKLGVQQGDVLLTVGGNDVFKPEDAINAYFSLIKEDHLEVKVDRAGKVFPIDIEFR